MSSVNVSVNNKFSVRLALKVHRLKKMLKPVLRLINLRKASHCVECSSAASKASKASKVSKASKASWADDCESQNDANEALESRLEADIARAAGPGGLGGVMTVWAQGQWTLVEVAPGQAIRVPVAFLAAPDSTFLWAPLADGDVCLGGYAAHVQTSGQAAEEQVPTAAQRCTL